MKGLSPMKRAFMLASLMAALALGSPPASAQFGIESDDLEIELQYLRDRLGEINTGSSSIISGSEFESLIIEADSLLARYPDAADVWGWRGIIKYYYHNTMDEVSALSMAESAKNDLEIAVSIDFDAVGGTAYTYLGSLYLYTPIWPAGFGDEERAGDMLRRGVSLNPDDLDANYFLARYLMKRSEMEEARYYLEQALNSPSRAGRESSDLLVREDIADLLEEITK